MHLHIELEIIRPFDLFKAFAVYIPTYQTTGRILTTLIFHQQFYAQKVFLLRESNKSKLSLYGIMARLKQQRKPIPFSSQSK